MFYLLHFHQTVIKIIYSLIGNYLASASYDNTLKLWKMSDYSLVKTLTGHTDHVSSVAFSPDGNQNYFIH